MKRAGSGFSRLSEVREAVTEAVTQAAEGLAPHTLWIILSHHHAEWAGVAAQQAQALQPSARILVGSGYGAISDRGESELEPGLAVLAVADPGLRLEGRAVLDPTDDLAAELALGPQEVTWLFLSSTALWPESVAGALAETTGGLITGGGVNGSWGAPGVAIAGRSGRPEGWAVGLTGAATLDWTLSQALAPQGPYLPVERIVGDRLLALGGCSAGQAARQHLGEERFAAWQEGRLSVFLRVPRGESGKADRIYNCSGLDAGRDAIFVPGLEETASEAAFAVLDGAAAEQEFRAELARLRHLRPAFGIYVNCCGRGLDLYGRLGVDAELFRESFPGVPLLGLSSSFELAPRGRGARLCAYTGILVLIG